MAQHKKDYESKILKNKTDSNKQRSTIKRNIKITQEDLDKLDELNRKEKLNGVEKSTFRYKGNYMFYINKLLYNPRLQPKERLCYHYQFTGDYVKGKLRNKDTIEVKASKGKYEGSNREYTILINGKIKAKIKGQKNAMYKVMEIIGLPKGWDYEQGSKRIFNERI
jgi:hypothetical protein